AGEQELFVIGGAQVFALALPLAQRFYLTRVHTDAGCDVFFPDFDMDAWRVLSQREFAAGGKNEQALSILELERQSSGCLVEAGQLLLSRPVFCGSLPHRPGFDGGSRCCTVWRSDRPAPANHRGRLLQ